MSTYFQGLSDTGLAPLQYTPNFELMQHALDKATLRYEQNFDKVSSLYNEVANKPITNDKLRTDRDEYVKSIQNTLKDIIGSDLSLPENVTTAENLFTPFYTN